VSRTIAVVGGTGPAGTGLALRWAACAGETAIIGLSRCRTSASRRRDILKRAGRKCSSPRMENWQLAPPAICWGLPCRRTVTGALLKAFEACDSSTQRLFRKMPPFPLLRAVGGRASRYHCVWQGSASATDAELVRSAFRFAVCIHIRLSSNLLNEMKMVDCDVYRISD